MIIEFKSAGKENNGSYYNDKITQAKGIMKPFILRRLKTEVFLLKVYSINMKLTSAIIPRYYKICQKNMSALNMDK